MKRFRWPLQRLLDVTAQKEKALQSELLRLSRQMAIVRQEIVRRQAVIRTSLAHLARQSLEQRIPQQEIVMACSTLHEKEIQRQREKLKSLEAQRRKKNAEFFRTRSSRETLERMREEARQLHIREQLKAEQKQFDEGAHVSFAYKAAERRTERRTAGG